MLGPQPERKVGLAGGFSVNDESRGNRHIRSVSHTFEMVAPIGSGFSAHPVADRTKIGAMSTPSKLMAPYFGHTRTRRHDHHPPRSLYLTDRSAKVKTVLTFSRAPACVPVF